MTTTTGLKVYTTRSLCMFDTCQKPVAKFPQLGPAIFTEEDQKKNPEKQMTRLVKDVLRVGRWKVGFQKDEKSEWVPVYWNVTEDTLDEIVDNFHLQLQNGVTHPLCWGHVTNGKPDIDARETISQVDDLFHENGTLYMTSYVSRPQATILQNQKRQVSIGADSDIEDGEGRIYPGESLVHVAVVEHPVVPGQGEFIQLSQPNKKLQTPQAGSKKMAITFETLVAGINQLLPDGADLPTEGEGAVTEENFDQMFALALSMMGKKDPAEEAGDDTTDNGGGGDSEIVGEPVGDVPALEELPVEMQNRMKKDPAMLSLFNHFSKKIGESSKELSLIKATERKAKEDAFSGRLSDMGRAGLDPKTITELKQLGKQTGYELSLLKPYEKLCDADLMGNHSKQLGNPNPDNPGVKKTASKEDIERRTNAILGK